MPIEPRRPEPKPVQPGSAAPEPAEPSPRPQVEPSPGADRARADAVVPSPPSLPAYAPVLRDAMAKMTLDVFLYTEAKAERMVVINGRKYVEGQHVEELYLLEGITPEGVVLSYRGERAILRP
jgi:general secretion pathway protein B